MVELQIKNTQFQPMFNNALYYPKLVYNVRKPVVRLIDTETVMNRSRDFNNQQVFTDRTTPIGVVRILF